MKGPRFVLAPNPSPMTLDGTRTYVVGRSRPVVIDPGPAIPKHIRRVVSLLAGVRPLAIVLTHAHADHAGAAGALARITRGEIWAAEGEPNPGRRPYRVDRIVEDGDELGTDEGDLIVLATPGHARDHVSLRWTGRSAPPGGAVFVGDLLLGEGDTTLVAFPEGSVAEYLRSLDRIDAEACRIAIPAHGPPLEAREAIDRFRRHRLERVARVREILRHTPDIRPEAIVDAVYGSELEPEVRPLAVASVRAVMKYLSSELTSGNQHLS